MFIWLKIHGGFILSQIAAYGLSGDPVTNEHRWVLEYASEIYEKVFLVMTANTTKKYTFPPLDRITMCRHLANEFSNVEFLVLSDDDFLARKAADLGANVLLRGLHNNTTKEYEDNMYLFNKWLVPEVKTVYVQPPGETDQVKSLSSGKEREIIRFASSSLVKSIVGLKDWKEVAKDLVPYYVLPFLENLSKRPKD